MKIGICFSKKFEGNNPIGHIDVKLPTYLRLLTLCKKKGWEVYILTRRTYKGNGVFDGVWEFVEGKFNRIEKPVKIDLVYDKSAGVAFPPVGDESVIWVNNRDFKILAWNKWKGYQEIGKYMPATFFVGSKKDIPAILPKIKTDWVVLKPFNGLKGFGVFVGPKNKALNFIFPESHPIYIAQEFIDTSGGIPGVTSGLHDLRVVIVNGKIVWSHVRVPPEGSFKANAATGGILTEIDLGQIPSNVLEMVEKISKKFLMKYDNPIYSLDFGISGGKKPYIFEINDQIGFPKWEMKNRDNFLNAMITNFEDKLSARSKIVPE
jgi:glutathione synthase/RimK-type ligase-like ATP-grasp enzyme